jgi:predicted GNAT family N-acyltransferase
MHAREVAVGFYRKCGYAVQGEPFLEVTIPHFHMEKKL